MSDFLFLDLETTGLNPERCQIIEVACVLTKDDFVPYAEFESLVAFTRAPLDPRGEWWEADAWRMHAASGLLAELPMLESLRDDNSLLGVETRLIGWLSKHLSREKANLAGNSVHFDRSFLHVHWPRVEWYLTHRHLDVSSLRLAALARGYKMPEMGDRRPHRAMPDVKASIAELRYWLDKLGGLHPEDWSPQKP